MIINIGAKDQGISCVNNPFQIISPSQIFTKDKESYTPLLFQKYYKNIVTSRSIIAELQVRVVAGILVPFGYTHY